MIHQVADLSFFLRHKQLLRVDFLAKLLLHALVGVAVQNQLAEHLFILVVLLLVELQEVFFAVEILLQLLEFFFQFVFLSADGCIAVAVHLLTDEDLSVEGVPLPLEADNLGLESFALLFQQLLRLVLLFVFIH